MSNYFRIKFVDTAPYLAISGASPSMLPKVRKLNEKVVPSQNIASNASYETSLSYDATKLYIAISVADVQHLEAPTLYGWSVSEVNNHIAITNTTNDSINIADVTVGYIDSTNAEVVKVVSTGGMPIVFRNAFKYTEDGTSYWYVVGITHTGWVTDLSTVGYEEVSPAPALPTVSVTGDFGVNNTLYIYGGGMGLSVPIFAGETVDATLNGTTKVTYDNGKSYGVVYWFTGTPGRTDIALINNNSNLAFKNITNQKFYTRYATVAVCSSNLGTVVTVYDSSNNAYNAFRFTASGTDYYYVLDGVQTDWTDDLSSIGYYPSELEILLGFKWDNDLTSLEAVNDLSNDYYWARVISQNDKDILTSMGIWYSNISNTKYGGLVYDSRYTYSFVAIYSDIGETIAPQHDPDKCLIRSYAAAQVIGLYYDGTSSESVMTWKCRITKNA